MTSNPLFLLGLSVLFGLGCDSGDELEAQSTLPRWDSESELDSNGEGDAHRAARMAIVLEDGIWEPTVGAIAPQVGEEAPDFNLKPIKFYGFKTEETDITEENAGVLYEPVRLASFRGKRPVALIFGSYT